MKKFRRVKSFAKEITNEKVQHVRPMIIESNIENLRIYSFIAIFTWAVLFFLSFVSTFMSTFQPLYLLTLTASVITAVLSSFARHSKTSMFLAIGILVSSHVIFGLISGTVLDPEGAATSFVALTFILPLLFCMRPLYILLIILMSDVSFVTCCTIFKEGEIMKSDIINVCAFSFVAFFIAIMFNRVRIKQFILESELIEAKIKEEARSRELEEQCNIDELTGMGNFYSYKRICNQFSETCVNKQPVGIVFADLNRLKYVNDTEGHEAGNDYIRTFADKLRKTFGNDYECFRHSGDEFIVVCLDGIREKFIVKVYDFIEQIKAEEIPMASIGYAFGASDKIEKITTQAEERMYDDKQTFYTRFPEFKRATWSES